MENRSVYNYKDIIYTCFQPEESLSEHCLPHHALIYVYSGEININDDGTEHTVHAGEYIFLKKDNRVRIHKHTLGTEPYKDYRHRVPYWFFTSLHSAKAV